MQLTVKLISGLLPLCMATWSYYTYGGYWFIPVIIGLLTIGWIYNLYQSYKK